MAVLPQKGDLIDEARSQWGDEWYVETIEFATGEKQHQVHHTDERVADCLVIRDVLRWDDDEVLHTRELIEVQRTRALVCHACEATQLFPSDDEEGVSHCPDCGESIVKNLAEE